MPIAVRTYEIGGVQRTETVMMIGRRAAHNGAQVECSAALMEQREEGATLAPFHDDEEVGGLQAGADEEDDVRMPQFAEAENK